MTTEFLLISVALSVLAALLIGIPVWRHRGAGNAMPSALGNVALLVGLPLLVLSLYTQVSSYPWDNPERLTAPPPGAALAPEQIAGMVSELAERMEREPSVEGLTMLGRSYMTLQRYEEAVAAYHQAWEMTQGEAPMVSLSYAEALILADRDTILTSAADLLDKALISMPNNPKALWYGGMSSIARGDMATGQARWGQLLNNPDIPPQLRTVVQQQLSAMNAASGDSADANGAAASPDTTAAPKGVELSITVNLADNLTNGDELAGVLYVFARDAGQPGPPVAVKRIRVREFPVQLTLADSDAMISGNSLANIKKLQLTARLSATGNAIASSGDRYGELTPEWNGTSQALSLTIDSVVE